MKAYEVKRPLALQGPKDSVGEGENGHPTGRPRDDAEIRRGPEDQLEMQAILVVDRPEHRVLSPEKGGVLGGIWERGPLAGVVGLGPALVIGDGVAVAHQFLAEERRVQAEIRRGDRMASGE